jgi:transposase
MRYELSDYEWTAIKPMLPNKPRGVRRVNDRRVLNGIFWVLRSGAPWRDLPETFGPRTTCYNRLVRWRRAGVWDQIMDALAAGHDAAVADDRYLRRARAPARSLYCGQQSPGYGSLTRGPDEQNSRGRGHQWPAGPSRPHAR